MIYNFFGDKWSVLGIHTDEAFSATGLKPLNGFIKCIKTINKKTYYAILDKARFSSKEMGY